MQAGWSQLMPPASPLAWLRRSHDAVMNSHTRAAGERCGLLLRQKRTRIASHASTAETRPGGGPHPQLGGGGAHPTAWRAAAVLQKGLLSPQGGGDGGGDEGGEGRWGRMPAGGRCAPSRKRCSRSASRASCWWTWGVRRRSICVMRGAVAPLHPLPRALTTALCLPPRPPTQPSHGCGRQAGRG